MELKQPRILIIEDDKDTNDVISAILSDAGFDTLSSLDGEDGLSKAKQESPDIIILDLMLPRINGLDVCRMLSSDEKTRTIPVIILTAKSELSTKLSSFVAGAKRFLTKPFEAQDLVNEIRRTIRQKEIAKSLADSEDENKY